MPLKSAASAYCSRCGAEYPTDAIFCSKCGARTAPPDAANSKPAPMPTRSLAGRPKLIMLTFVAVVVVFFLYWAASYHLLNKGGLQGVYAARDVAGGKVAAFTFDHSGGFVYAVGNGSSEQGWYTVMGDSLNLHYYPISSPGRLPYVMQGGTYELTPDHRSFFAGLFYSKE